MKFDEKATFVLVLHRLRITEITLSILFIHGQQLKWTQYGYVA